LHQHFPQLNVIEGDFLKLDLNSIFPEKFFVIGNFPYNISSQIFFKMLDNKDSIPCLAGMIQKEVAERIAAPAGSKTYGILSVLMQAYYKIEYLFTVHEHVFDPPPKVKSAVIRFTRNDVSQINCNEQLFKSVVKTAFNQRRKTLRNSLLPLVEKGNPMFADPLFDLRPERLDVAAFIDLTNRVEAALKA
jgi:16S rRNA (adenine1518-N6/adenine1519-N6)-dimethyltransferase